MGDLFELDVGKSADILKYLIESDIVDADTIHTGWKMKERQKKLSNYRVWQGSGNKKWYTKIDGKLVKRTYLEDLEDLIVEHYDKMENPSFRDLFTEWLDFKLKYKEIQKQTYDRYIADYNKFVKGTRLDDIPVILIDEDMLEIWIRDTIVGLELTAKSWAKCRTILIGTFKWAYKYKHTHIVIKQFLSNIELSPKMFKKKRFVDEESVFTDDEVKQITGYINNVDPSIINYGIILAFQTGLRVGELAALTWEDVKEDYITVNKTEIRYKDELGDYVYAIRDNAKTDAGDRNVLYLNDAEETLQCIKMLNSDSEYVFFKNGERIHAKAFTKKLERICGYLGFLPKSMHKARKTYATKLITSGVDKKLIIRQMGHTNIKTTDTYYYFNAKTREQSKAELGKIISG